MGSGEVRDWGIEGWGRTVSVGLGALIFSVRGRWVGSGLEGLYPGRVLE